MEEDDDDGIGLVRLRTWDLSLHHLTQAHLSPTFKRLLLFYSSTATANLLTLHSPSHSPVSFAPLTCFAWGCQKDCYGVSGIFEELLFASNDRGLLVYGFATKSDATTGPILEIAPDLGSDAQGRPKLVFLEAESWPETVVFALPYASHSLSRLIDFATDREECSSSATITSLFSSGKYVGMVLRIGQATRIIICTIYDTDIRWHARVNPSADEEWVEFCMTLDKCLGLTKNGKVFIWDAITGQYSSLLTAPTASALKLVPAQGLALVGVVDASANIFLLSLEHTCSTGASRPWEVAASDVWFSPSSPPPGPSAFTPKRLLLSEASSGRKRDDERKLRQVVLPSLPSDVTAVGINPWAVTRLINNAKQETMLLQSGLHAHSHTLTAKRSFKHGQVLGFSFQGSLYIITPTFLAVVLPPFMAERISLRREPWWLTGRSLLTFQHLSSMQLDNPALSLQMRAIALLDRCLVYDGLEEAEHLYVENGWNVRFARLRNLQLALDYQRADEIGPLLDKLVSVDAAEAGILRIIFSAVELMMSRLSTDNDRALASRLLALAARFTRDLLKNCGNRKLTGLVPVRHINDSELAQLLETIRSLQEQLYARRNRSKAEKSDYTETAEKLEKRSHGPIAVDEPTSLVGALVPSEEESNSKKHPSQESPKEMIARWEKDNVDALGIVKDALRAGRVPLAVVQLHHKRSEASQSKETEADVFREVQDIGRSVAYELFCKGKVPLALAALRRLGEDVFTVLHELAFGTVRRSLRTIAARELRRHGRLDSRDCQLLSTVSRIEGAYPSNKFWSSYCMLQKTAAPPDRLHLCFSTPSGELSVECAEVDGVVLGTWSRAVGIMEDEVVKEEASAAYWAGALIWLLNLDQQTIDRMLLEQSEAADAAWKSRLEFAVVHHSWPSLSALISDEMQTEEGEICLRTSGIAMKIPNVKHLVLDLTACSGWLWHMTEWQLARSCVFLRLLWTDAEELLSLLVRAGQVFCTVGYHDRSQLSEAVFQLVVNHCVQHNLPWLLELFIDNHATGSVKQAEDVSIVGDSEWPRWLLLSLHKGSEYNASFANARTVRSSNMFSTLDDLASFGSEVMALATLVHAPVLPQKCLYSGYKRQLPAKSWQCALQTLQRGLHDYPTLLNAFIFRCVSSNVRLDRGYLQWRKSLFFSTSGDTSVLLMSPIWLPKPFRKILHLSIQGYNNASFVDPIALEGSVRESLENELRASTCETSSSNVEQYLLRGCPLAAFRYIVALRADAGRVGELAALDKDEQELLKVVMPLAIRKFKNRVVTAACSLLLDMCGVSATRLRTDVSALRRIFQHVRENAQDISMELASLLAGEYAQKDLGGDIEKRSAALVLEHLERASIGNVSEAARGCGLWLKNGEDDGQRIRTSQMLMSESWSLVTTFCRVHHLPTSTVYLSYLAKDNDWVGFLAQAQADACSLDVLLGLTSNFSDEHLRSHIITVLKGLCVAKDNNDVPQGSLPSDLFSLLAEAEGSKTPGLELLRKAKELRWALLTVVATCFQDVTPLTCLATWLEVTAEREVNEAASQLAASVGAAVDSTNANSANQPDCPVYERNNAKRRRLLSSEAKELSVSADSSAKASHLDQRAFQPADVGNDESLSKTVAILCEQQRFIPLLRAFELFHPASPILHFIRFLQAFSQMRLSEASSHLGDFSTLLKEEIQSKGARGGTTWISKAALAGADAMLAACPSAYEKRCMLQLLSSADFGDGGSAAMGYRKLFWKIQLAEPLLRQGRSPAIHASDLDDQALLNELEKNGEWEEARSWARQLDLNQHGSSYVHHVTEMQAEAMVTEWKELLWDVPEQRAALWRHCQSLFTKHLYPPLKAGMFFLKHAEDIEQHGLAAELHAVLLLALQWLSGCITGSAPVYPVHLLRELETRVWLLAVESEVLMKTSTPSTPSYRLGAINLESSLNMHSNNASPVDRTAAKIAAVDGHLNIFKSMQMDFVEDVRQVKALTKDVPKPKRRLVRRIYNSSLEKEQSPMDTNNRGASDEDSGAGWEEKVGENEVERAILALVEVGQVSAARQLQHKLLPSRVPEELKLAETVYSIAMLSSPTVKGSIRGSVLGANIMKTLNSLSLLKDLSSASPLQVMEALRDACREGCGRGHCKRVTAVAQVANFLDLAFFEAFQKQPTELLQLLSLKGQDALAEAKLLVSTHSINPASVARILAESFLKGLLAAHRGGYMDSSSSSREEGPAPLLWRSSDFVQWGQLCPSQPELGHALMRLVISGHDMPHACEVELLILAHQFYESSACLDGMDVLVALAATRVESYVSEGDFAALARLVTGVSNFQALRFVLDLLIENGQLELLLKKRANVEATKESSASVRGFRMAVLSALRHFNPHDLDAFGMVYSHFSMAHEMANLLESRGRKGLSHWFIRNDPDQNEELLDIMRFFVEASEIYAGIDCGNKTRWCCAQASLLSLQLRMPEMAWLNLTETNARRLLVDQRRFQEALIVAEAYNLNQPAEWVPVLWNQVLSPGWIEHFLSEFVASLPLRPPMLMELARIYRSEVSARGDHRDFSKWLTSGMPPEITKSFRCILKHVGDFRLRTQLTTLASGFPDVLDVCARILDKVPDTAGPLVLRRGHGQIYVPLM